MINEANPNHNYLALRSMEAMEKVADGKATKLIVPSDMQNLAATVSAIKKFPARPQSKNLRQHRTIPAHGSFVMGGFVVVGVDPASAPARQNSGKSSCVFHDLRV